MRDRSSSTRLRAARSETILFMAANQTWDPATYAKNARFVSDLGWPVLDLLSPQPGERILDLGCGDGVLTRKIADLGCEVVGIDSSAAQVEAAKKLGVEVHVLSNTPSPHPRSRMRSPG